MPEQMESGYDAGGAGTAEKFLAAIKNGDAMSFWELMDKEGQGYFKGMWFYALGGMDVSTLAVLTCDEGFLRDALGQIMSDLKASLAPLLEEPQIGVLQCTNGQHGVVPITVTAEPGAEPLTDYIPLVLELAPPLTPGENRAGCANPAMTCWKVDTLKCFSFMKSEMTQ